VSQHKQQREQRQAQSERQTRQRRSTHPTIRRFLSLPRNRGAFARQTGAVIKTARISGIHSLYATAIVVAAAGFFIGDSGSDASMTTRAQRIEFKERIHRDNRLNGRTGLIALRLYDLSLKKGHSWASVDQLMQMEAVKDRSTVQRSTAKLLKLEYFTVKLGGGKHQRNEYRPVYLSHADAVAKLAEFGIKLDTEDAKPNNSRTRSQLNRGATINPDRAGPLIDGETFEDVVEDLSSTSVWKQP
jgi:hypothetical protein